MGISNSRTVNTTKNIVANNFQTGRHFFINCFIPNVTRAEEAQVTVVKSREYVRKVDTTGILERKREGSGICVLMLGEISSQEPMDKMREKKKIQIQNR